MAGCGPKENKACPKYIAKCHWGRLSASKPQRLLPREGFERSERRAQVPAEGSRGRASAPYVRAPAGARACLRADVTRARGRAHVPRRRRGRAACAADGAGGQAPQPGAGSPPRACAEWSRPAPAHCARGAAAQDGGGAGGPGPVSTKREPGGLGRPEARRRRPRRRRARPDRLSRVPRRAGASRAPRPAPPRPAPRPLAPPPPPPV